ncbi:MAG: winged helix-turn-helix transcriptional regulator [Acidimicrobiia bacterium]|nr:winged helix-turn-helix transcriptional regulator [Acidimicrobiia bacterium]
MSGQLLGLGVVEGTPVGLADRGAGGRDDDGFSHARNVPGDRGRRRTATNTNLLRVTLSASPVDRALESRLPPGSRDLTRIIGENARASTGDIAAATGRSRPVVIRQLKALESAGIVEWVGRSPKDPRTYWTLKIE